MVLVNDVTDVHRPFYLHSELAQAGLLGVDEYTQIWPLASVISFSR
jgi:hypothetical protein